MHRPLSTFLLCGLMLPAACAAPAQAGPQAHATPAATAAPAGHARWHTPRPGLHTGGQPSAQDLAALKAGGVHTVIDLRAPHEDRGYDEADAARRLGLEYIALPIAGGQDLTPANTEALRQLLDNHGDGVLLHCASGNRVGALLALVAAGDGATPAQALELGRRAGLGTLEAVVAPRLEHAGHRPCATGQDDATAAAGNGAPAC